MSALTPHLDDGPLTYGNWRRPRTFGVGRFGMAGTVVLLGGVFASLLAQLAVGWLPAVVLMLLDAVMAVVLMVPDRHGQTRGQRLVIRAGWWNARSGRRHLYRSGPLGRVPYGTCQLPGVLASTRLSEHHDGWGQPFAVLEMPRRGHFSITFACESDGESLVDRGQVDNWVALWGEFIASLGNDSTVAALSVTVETAPDRGHRLRERVESWIDPDAPAVARETMREVVASYPAQATRTGVWVTITYRAAAVGKRRTVDEFAADVAPEIPGLIEALNETGVAGARSLMAQELCELARSAYDPAAGSVIEDAHAHGETPVLRWDDVGPIAAEAGWDRYRHDNGLSVTWAMTGAPRGVVQSHVLRRLLSPHKTVERKRVTLIYRILDPGKAPDIVAADVRAAESRVNIAERPSATTRRLLKLATLTEEEEANGAALVDFAVLITATLTDPSREQLASATATVESLAAQCKINLRRLYGSQDSAFAACLPLGLVIADYLAVPREIRGAL